MKPFKLYKVILLLFAFGTTNLYAVKPANTETVATISTTKVVKEKNRKVKKKARLIEKFKKKFADFFAEEEVSLNENQEPRTHGFAIASLVLGIIGLLTTVFGIGLALCALAVVFGIVSKKKIKNSGGFYKGKSMAIAGFVLGLIPLVAVVVLLLITFSLEGF